VALFSHDLTCRNQKEGSLTIKRLSLKPLKIINAVEMDFYYVKTYKYMER
jgi:hypothetical protein